MERLKCHHLYRESKRKLNIFHMVRIYICINIDTGRLLPMLSPVTLLLPQVLTYSRAAKTQQGSKNRQYKKLKSHASGCWVNIFHALTLKIPAVPIVWWLTWVTGPFAGNFQIAPFILKQFHLCVKMHIVLQKKNAYKFNRRILENIDLWSVPDASSGRHVHHLSAHTLV